MVNSKSCVIEGDFLTFPICLAHSVVFVCNVVYSEHVCQIQEVAECKLACVLYIAVCRTRKTNIKHKVLAVSESTGDH
jgi:hypothetical protein